MSRNRLSSTKSSMALRHGMSLIELMVVLSLLGVTLSSVTVALAGISKAAHNQRRAEEAARIAERLVHQFRNDVHQARGTIDVAANELVCRLPHDIEVTYTLPSEASATNAIDRIERSAERILSRKSFQLAAGERATFSSSQSDKHPVIQLRIENDAKAGVWRAVALAPSPEGSP